MRPIYIEGKRNGYGIDQCGQTLTVGELIEILEQFDYDRPIFLRNDNGYTYGSITERDIEDAEEEAAKGLSLGGLLMQGVATSIDALSVGFTIAEYDLSMALVSSLIIAVVTFCICMGGLILGKKAGTRLSGKASILGGVILIAIGLEIFISGLIG